MISAKELQNKYNKLYVSLREYIWPLKIVENIADLEVAVYRTFPDIDEVRTCYNVLKMNALRLVKDDEELEGKFEDFREILDSSDNLYSKINTRRENGGYHEDI